MSDRPATGPSDDQLMAQIEALVSGQPATQPADARAEFASFVAQARPVFDEGRRAALEQRLLAEWQQQLGRATQAASRELAGSRRQLVPRWRRGLAAALALLLLLLIVSPAARLLAADVLDQLQRAYQSISAGPDGLTSLQPPPPFAVVQPGYRPAGLKLVGNRYDPGAAAGPGVQGQVMRLEPQTMRADAWVKQAIERDRGPRPHLLLVYRSAEPRYATLYQRQAQAGESLPAGAARSVSGQPAVLEQEQGVLRLTWIAAGTWIELESTYGEAELQRIAAGLVPFQQPSADAGQRWGDWLRSLSRLQPCAGVEKPSHGQLLGRLAGQAYLGSVQIELLSNGEREWDHTSWGSNVPDGKRQIMQPALGALRMADLSVQQLPYPALSFQSTEAEPCLRPNPSVQGYYVIEVWSEQVQVGGRGHSPALQRRAIEVLERAIED